MDINRSCYVRPNTNYNLSDGYLSSEFSSTVDNILGVIFAGTSVLSLTLNAAVIVTVARRKRKCQPVELFIINMAVCDFLQSLICLPAFSVAAFSHGWVMGIEACIFEAFLVFFFGCASIWNLATLSLARYLVVCCPNLGKYTKRPAIWCAIVLCYIHSGFWCLVPFAGWGEYGPEPYGISCSIAWTCASVSYIVSLLLACYVIPVAVMIFSYVRMANVICKSSSQCNRSVSAQHDVYLTKMACAMCGCFLVAWTPYAITSLLYMFGHKIVHHSLTVGSPILAKTSLWTNPVVYFFSVKRFRHELFSLFCNKTFVDMSCQVDNTDFKLGDTRIRSIPENGITSSSPTVQRLSHPTADYIEDKIAQNIKDKKQTGKSRKHSITSDLRNSEMAVKYFRVNNSDNSSSSTSCANICLETNISGYSSKTQHDDHISNHLLTL